MQPAALLGVLATRRCWIRHRFAGEEVKLFLKGRSRIIPMTDLGDGIPKLAKCRVICEYEKSASVP